MRAQIIRARDIDRPRLFRLRENVLDAEIVLDDARRDVESTLKTLQAALRDRNAAAAALAKFLSEAAA